MRLSELTSQIPKVLEKNATISEALRTHGNEFYKSKNLALALRCYTLSLCYAPKDSKCEALAYSNRSACFLESKQHGLANNDIMHFERISSNWTEPSDLKIRQRIQERKAKISSLLKPEAHINIAPMQEFFTIPVRNAAVPSASSAIGIKNDNERGRHVCNVSNEAIPPGQAIILERPFAHILLKTYDFELKHCNYCVKDLHGGGIPCRACVFFIYCSTECQELDSEHHKHECECSPLLFELNMTRTDYLSLSIVLKLNPMQLEDYFKLATATGVDLPGFTNGVYDSEAYEPINKLIYHNEILTNNEMFNYATHAVLVADILEQKTMYFSSVLKTEVPKAKAFISTLMFLHQMNLPCNAHSLYKLECPQNPTEDDIRAATYEEVGAGAFALLSMINHSCSPNVVRVTLPNGNTAVISIKIIKPGEEVQDNYGEHFALTNKASRNKFLSSTYNFTCRCEACVGNWPTINQLKDEPSCTCKNAKKCLKCKSYGSELEKLEDSTELLLQNKVEESIPKSIQALEYFDNLEQKPCKPVSLAQETLKQALFLVSKKYFQ
ncbi:SET and MYND domain-containing protein 4 [Orchesella cincta]|uniref:Protein-lysine N-methyltransferase SMYD4 n=1 Tax=Orchesella cincta TaxID=48709 RepID=A0A1D2MFN0_ORCCI|nr:SET and MYND domain-containing protein 4 [Orchesella cincta]